MLLKAEQNKSSNDLSPSSPIGKNKAMILESSKSVRVQLKKLEIDSPQCLCCQKVNTVTGRQRKSKTTEVQDSLFIEHFSEDEAQTLSSKAIAERESAERDFWYKNRYRQTYNSREEEALVKYFLTNGGYSRKGGNKVWQKMEEDWICPGRTWQSMRERFEKSILPDLKRFGVTHQQLLDVDLNSKENLDINTSIVRGFRQNANYYDKDEDMKILNFIIENKRFNDLGGNDVWKVMQDRKILDGRSWHSMKERFRKVILKNIDSYGLHSDMSKAFKNLNKKRQKRMTR